MFSTVEQSFLNYISFEKRYSKHTLIAYQNDLEDFKRFLLQYAPEKTCSSQAQHQELRAYLIELSKEKQSVATIHRRIATIRTFFKFLLLEGRIEANPTLKLKLPKKAKRNPAFIPEGDLDHLFEQSPTLAPELEQRSNEFYDLQTPVVIKLFYGTGIRISELCSIKIKDISFFDSTLRVTGKRNKERIIPLFKDLLEAIQQFISEKETTFNHRTEFLFCNTKGNQITPGVLRPMVKRKLGEFTTLEKKNPHVLRHTFATHLLNEGADINAIKELLGHSSLKATEVYTHNSFEKIKKAYKNAHPKA